MKRENIVKISAAVIITVTLVAILLSQIKIADIIVTLAGIDPLCLILGFVLYVCGYFFRALRFHILLNRYIRLWDLFNIVCVYNMVNSILPARTGELSYIYLLKKLHNKKVGEGIATLFVVRMFDFIALSLLFFISALIIEDLPEMIMKAVWAIAGFLVLMILILIVSVYFGEKFMKIIKKIVMRLNSDKFRIINFLLEKGGEAKGCFRTMQSKKVIFYCFLLSILVWFPLYLMAYVLLNGMGVNLIIWLVILGMTLLMLLNLLPVQGVGKFGTYEGAWAVAFISLGFSKEVAIISGFSVHIFTIIYFLILGCYGLFMLKFKNKIF